MLERLHLDVGREAVAAAAYAGVDRVHPRTASICWPLATTRPLASITA